MSKKKRNRQKNIVVKNRSKRIYPQKRTKKPIDKKAFMRKNKKCLTILWFIIKERPMKKSVNNKKVKNTFKEWFIDKCNVIGQFLLKEAVKEIIKEAIKYLVSIMIQ